MAQNDEALPTPLRSSLQLKCGSGKAKVAPMTLGSSSRGLIRSPREPRMPLWEPKRRCDVAESTIAAVGTNASTLGTTAPAADARRPAGGQIALRLRSLVVEQVSANGSSTPTEDFAECCLISFAVWRRFGTAAFAEALGWVHRTDLAAMNALLGSRAVDAAVQVWRTGQHAVEQFTDTQRCARRTEISAWELGAQDEVRDLLRRAEQSVALAPSAQDVANAKAELATIRARCVTLAGEHMVRNAYSALLNAVHHPILAVWERRQALVCVALGSGGFGALRDELLRVRGYGKQNPDAEWAGWELALDLKTLTPLADDPEPVLQSSDYTTWLRQRITDRCKPKASSFAIRRLDELRVS